MGEYDQKKHKETFTGFMKEPEPGVEPSYTDLQSVA